jgi:hypothetical protein
MNEIYFFIALAWILLIAGRTIMKDYAMTAVSAMFITVLGGVMLGAVGFGNAAAYPVIWSAGMIHICLGIYFIFRCNIELNREPVQPIRLFKQNGEKNTRNKARGRS